MSCTASRCPTLRKGGHCCQLQHRHRFSASQWLWHGQPGLDGVQANPLQRLPPGWPPGHPDQWPHFSTMAQIQAGSASQTPAPTQRCSNQTPSRASAAQPREEHEISCALCVPQSSALVVGFWGVSAPPMLSIAPLPFFSIASTSFTRRGGATSGGLNCSCKSGRGDPGGEGGREGLSTSSALSSRAGPGHNPGNSQQEQGKPWLLL